MASLDPAHGDEAGDDLMVNELPSVWQDLNVPAGIIRQLQHPVCQALYAAATQLPITWIETP